MKRAVLFFVVVGCNGGDPVHETDLSWSRMMQQPRGNAYGRSSVFADGMVMRTPPSGTRPVERHATPDKTESGAWVETIPSWITRASIERGHERYDQFCSVCHGIAGDGDSVVATKMLLRKPPSYADAVVLALPPGALHDVVAHGYGFMPSYAAKLDDDQQWEVVAYVLALRRSEHAVVRDLQPALRAELAEAAP